MRREKSKITLLHIVVFTGALILLSGLMAQSQDLPNNPPVAADWGYFQYLNDTTQYIFYINIFASDSILHVYADDCNDIYHFTSIDNGVSWSLLANEGDPDIPKRGGPVMAYYGHDKVYTIYETFSGFAYFKASTDYGQTWAWARQLRAMEANGPVYFCNITGNGDTVFVVSEQSLDGFEYLHLWRSFNAGHNWQHIDIPVDGWGFWHPGFEYDKSKSILHLTYKHCQSHDSCDVYYIRSIDLGTTWGNMVLIGLPNYSNRWGPAMESDGIGNIAIIWPDAHQQYGGDHGLFCRVSHDEGLTWQDTTKIGPTANAQADDVTISGNYIGAVWGEGVEPDGGLYYRESFDGGTTWDPPQLIAHGLFWWSISLLRINETIHIAFRQDTPYGLVRAGYVRYDPTTGIWDGVKYLMPSRTSLSAYPNPFNSSTMITYDGIEGGGAPHIYDIVGRLVRTLELDKSSGSVTWNADDDTGEAVSSGVYIARIIDPNSADKANIKLIYLR